MGIIKSTVRVGQKPPTEVLKKIKAAARQPLNLEDCPELPPETLKEFACMAAERNRQRRRQAVTIRVVPDVQTVIIP